MTETKLQHVAIIMDGNRRWAKKRGLEVAEGHRAGVEALAEITKSAVSMGVKFLTVYALSTENLKSRSPGEIFGLLQIIEEGLANHLPELQKEGVKIEFLGNTEFLPLKVKEAIGKAYSILQKNNRVLVNICLNYGARAEIAAAVSQIIDKNIEVKKINEKTVAGFLYTKNLPDPDLIIRTGGQKRLSNFLLWQGAYSELYFSDKLWPEFSPDDFKIALEDYYKRKRNFGL